MYSTAYLHWPLAQICQRFNGDAGHYDGSTCAEDIEMAFGGCVSLGGLWKW